MGLLGPYFLKHTYNFVKVSYSLSQQKSEWTTEYLRTTWEAELKCWLCFVMNYHHCRFTDGWERDSIPLTRKYYGVLIYIYSL